MPFLEAWVASKLQEEAAVLRKRRKGREDRLLTAGVGTEAGDGGVAAAGAGRGRGRGCGLKA